MATINGGATPSLSFTQAGTGFLAGTNVAITPSLSLTIKSGTAADQCDLLYAKTLTFVASTGQTLDLTALTDVFGNAVNFARVKAVVVKVYSTTDGATLTLAPDAVNGWSTGPIGASSSVVLQAASATNPNGAFLILTAPNTTGWVVNGTHKVLDLTPNAYAFNVDVVIAGCSV